MKRLILALFGISILAGTAAYLNRAKTQPPSPAEPVAAQAGEDRQAVEPSSASAEPQRPTALEPTTPRPAATAGRTAVGQKVEMSTLSQSVDVLVSPQASHEQKQGVWKQLREAGKLDQAIAELEQRTTTDPRVAEYPAALGQAYLQKCATIQDVREQGILAMQADKVFDTALTQDPSNWEARFTKAVALSYWPTNLNKSGEVIEHFQTLIQQQEAQTPQPHFAETYAWLGDQYQKAGQGDYARRVWERGAASFPNHEGLMTRLQTLAAAAR